MLDQRNALADKPGKWHSFNEKVGYFIAAEVPEEWHKALISTGPSSRDEMDLSYASPLMSGKL